MSHVLIFQISTSFMPKFRFKVQVVVLCEVSTTIFISSEPLTKPNFSDAFRVADHEPRIIFPDFKLLHVEFYVLSSRDYDIRHVKLAHQVTFTVFTDT